MPLVNFNVKYSLYRIFEGSILLYALDLVQEVDLQLISSVNYARDRFLKITNLNFILQKL